MKKTNKRDVGKQGEETAKQFLLQKGIPILEENFYFHGGEIDLIAKEEEYICFIEVKYRTDTKSGYPEEAVNRTKQHRIRLGAGQYLYQKQLPTETACRFDIISILGQEITWIKNAF